LLKKAVDTAPRFCELESVALLAFSGADAISFLHAQLTSDVAALQPFKTQFTGYCSPKGRLLATPLLWRRDSDILLQIPDALAAGLRAILSKYVLRSRVRISDVTDAQTLFGIAETGASAALERARTAPPDTVHGVSHANGVFVTRLPGERYLLLVDNVRADDVRADLQKVAAETTEAFWKELDIASGVPVVLPESQDQYVPQMVNLDVIGGISYSKGCYPGQEIVARTHYLGRLKQRMYRLRVDTSEPVRTGDPLYSPHFGAGQASGSILYGAPARGAQEALAVLQRVAVQNDVLRFGAPDGPRIQVLSLPYTLPD
jgi:folate-binding protein YgfZ